MPMLTGNRIYLAISLAILVCIFRRPLEIILPQKHLSPLFVFLPLILCVFLFFMKKERGSISKNIKEVYSKYKSCATLVFVLYFCLYLVGMFFSGERNISETIYELSQTTLFLLFPALLALSFKNDELVIILEYTLKPTLVIAFFLTSMEFLLLKFHYVSPMEIRFMLLGFIPDSDLRINTFMGQGAVSGLIPLSGYAYFLYKVLEEYLSGSKIRHSEIVISSLGAITVLMCDSITLAAIVFLLPLIVLSYFIHQKSFPIRDVSFINRFFLFLGIVTLILLVKMLQTRIPSEIYSYFFRHETVVGCDFFLIGFVLFLSLPIFVYHFFLYRNIRDRAKFDRLSLFLGILFFVFMIVLLKTPISDRLYSYFFNQHEILSSVKSYGPKFSGCNVWSLIFGVPFPHNFDLGSNCRPGEFHGLQMVFRTGLAMETPWFILLIYPLVILFQSYNRKKTEDLFKFVLGATVFVISEIHYAGVEIWGNNYVFGIFIVAILKEAEVLFFGHESRLESKGSSGGME